jgi:hypothetical protein
MTDKSCGEPTSEFTAREAQCQRTRCYLPFSIAEGQTAICPWCPDHETYERLIPNHFARGIVEGAIQMCRSEFGVGEDSLGTGVWLGDRPETVLEPHLNRCNIYLARDSDPWQIMYSGAHEAFHRVCSLCVGRHWADEMFAVLFSLIYLDCTGQKAHADINRRCLVAEAEACSTEVMFALSGPCPDGLYGQAYVLGSSLTDCVGWKRLKTLAVTKGADGRMDLAAWLSSLSAEDRENVLPFLPA